MTPVHEAARSALTTTVLRDAASSGGWAYFAGKTPRLEPMLWALAALSHAPDLPRPFPELAAPHLRFLERAQRADGLLVDAPGMPPNLAWNGLAATVLAAVAPDATPLLGRIVAGIIAVKGLRVANEPGGAQNNDLQASPPCRSRSIGTTCRRSRSARLRRCRRPTSTARSKTSS